MNKNVIKIMIIFILCMFTFNISEEKATDNYTMEQNEVEKMVVPIKNGYTIQQYDIDMVVNENNTYDITENITAYFNIPKHGIIRKIPLKNKVERVDGSKSSNIAKITNINVNDNYTLTKSGGFQVIQIGSSTKTLTGIKNYTIKYTYNIGKDKLKGADELYFNLIGTEWDTSIENVNFKITMPKEFDSSKLGFSTGNKGTIGTNNVPYNVTGTVITGSVNTTLYQGQGLNVRLTLPDNYFVGASSNFDIYSIVVIIFSITCVFITYRLWAKYGKDDEVVETVEFYPPDGYNSAEVGFMYHGVADNESIISLLVYLANKGYLKIEETEQEGLFSDTEGFKLTKLKEYDGNNEIERTFFNGLFKENILKTANMDKIKELIKEAKNQGEKLSTSEAMDKLIESGELKETVTSDDLSEKFYITLNKIKDKFNKKENKNKIFESIASGKIKWLILMIIAIFSLMTVKPILDFLDSSLLIFDLIFPLVGFGTFIAIVSNSSGDIYVNGVATSSKTAKMVFGLIFLIPFTILPFILVALPAILQLIGYIVMNIVGAICIVIILVFSYIMPKRTKFGTEMLGKIRGFKRFLETAEKSRLESLVRDNPEYFYNILPYTYALGVSDVWMKQFETIALEPPTWYISDRRFEIYHFNRFMNNTISSAKSVMTSSPAPSGGYSGGGFSGGGFSSGGGGFSGGGSGGGRRKFLVI